ncbi:MAG: GNAT family N-acetyltransferase [Ktedonobacteraceae bacterium]|nr:GNAT family N-acetyltransferase [Ktedonobacteraceae bacterium]MBO0794522.1 GNAT family N-acetyltransferase [Ktedonobacteraceae bacterium]
MQLQIRQGFDPQWLDDALNLYCEAGLGQKDADQLRKALTRSYRVVTCWNGEELCGIGRLISDGVYYASIFDVAVHPAYQRQGIGRLLMNELEQAVPGLRVYLTATFGKEPFYEKLGYRRHRTALAKYPPPFETSPYLDPPARSTQEQG